MSAKHSLVVKMPKKQKIFRTGNSLAVTIPIGFVKMVGVRPGDMAEIEIKPETGKVTYRFSGNKQLPLMTRQTHSK